MKIRLSPMDYYFVRPHLYSMRFLFEFEHAIEAKLLKAALLKVADVIPAVTGRLALFDGEMFLECGGFIPVKERILSFEPDLNDESQLEPLADVISNREGEPLVQITLTQTPSKLLMGVGFSHILGDGTSFFHFMHELARAAKGLAPLQPSFDYRIIFPRDSAEAFDESKFFANTGYTPFMNPYRETEEVRILYGAGEIESLKSAAQEQGYALTNNDLIMADLVKRFHREYADDDGVTLIRCPVDYRSRLGLANGFFGNAILDARVEFAQDEVEELSREEIAARIRLAVRSVNRESIERALHSLEGFRRARGLGAFARVGCPGLVVSNMTKVPLQGLDFGGGPPKSFRLIGMFPNLALMRAAAGGEEVILRKPKSLGFESTLESKRLQCF